MVALNCWTLDDYRFLGRLLILIWHIATAFVLMAIVYHKLRRLATPYQIQVLWHNLNVQSDQILQRVVYRCT